MKTWADVGIDIPSHAHGTEVDTTCPRCSPTRKKKQAKCLSVNLTDGIWLCHHCAWAGSLKHGEFQGPERRRSYVKPKEHRLTPLPANLLKWFANRGIPENVLARNRIGWGSVYFGELEDQVYAIQFPYYLGRELVNVKYRTLDKHFRMATGAERILYGLDDIDDSRSLIWVEGEIDKLSVETAGLFACVSVPDGAPDAKSKTYDSKFDFLEEQHTSQILDAIPEHILAVDNDANGQRLEEELSRRLGVEKCRRVQWPEGCKDANDVLRRHGPEAIQRCLLQAKPYPIAGLLDMDDIAEEYWQLYEHGLQPGVTTGWRTLDHLYTVKPGQLTIIVGVPFHGKSTWAHSLMVNLAQQSDWRIALYCPEDQPTARLASKLAQRYIGRPIDRNAQVGMSPEEYTKAQTWIQEHFHFLAPPEDDEATLEHILELARLAVLRYGIKGLLIDPWNEIEHLRPRELTETEYVAKCLRHIKSFNRRHGVHTWVIVHPTKLYPNDKHEYPVPTLYDASGSAHFRNKADCGIVIYRSSTIDCNITDVYVQKVKFREVGRTGHIQLAYHPSSERFSTL